MGPDSGRQLTVNRYRLFYAGRWVDLGTRRKWAETIARKLSLDEPTPVVMMGIGYQQAFYRGLWMW